MGSGIHYSLKNLPIIHLINIFCLFIKINSIIREKNCLIIKS